MFFIFVILISNQKKFGYAFYKLMCGFVVGVQEGGPMTPP